MIRYNPVSCVRFQGQMPKPGYCFHYRLKRCEGQSHPFCGETRIEANGRLLPSYIHPKGARCGRRHQDYIVEWEYSRELPPEVETTARKVPFPEFEAKAPKPLETKTKSIVRTAFPPEIIITNESNEEVRIVVKNDANEEPSPSFFWDKKSHKVLPRRVKFQEPLPPVIIINEPCQETRIDIGEDFQEDPFSPPSFLWPDKESLRQVHKANQRPISGQKYFGFIQKVFGGKSPF